MHPYCLPDSLTWRLSKLVGDAAPIFEGIIQRQYRQYRARQQLKHE
jgi:hypothetical protein